MKFTIFEFAGKERYLKQQLYAAGHSEAQNVEEIDLLLVDCDWPWAYPRPDLIQSAVNHGAKVVTYPHAGRPTVWVYDGIAEPNPLVDLRLEHGNGSVTIAKHFADDLKQVDVGWLFCPTRDFEPVEKPRKILFAPLHPNIEMLVKGTNGHDPAPATNNQIYRRLLELRDMEVVVSLSGPMWRHGVWFHPRARMVDNPQMRFEHSFEQILSADVVVGSGTMAAAAVALGKPTVMFDQDTFMDYVDGEYVQAEHADQYKDLVRYPLDAGDGDLKDLIDQACVSEQVEWRNTWIGTDGTETAIRLLEELVGEKNDVVIQGVTAKALTRR